MLTDAIHKMELHKGYRYLRLLCATTFFLAMIAAPQVFADTAAEMDLVGQREPAPEELELGQKVDLAEELDLAPSEAPSADCPTRTTSVRRTTPVRRVSPVTRYTPKPVHFPTQRTVTRYNPPPTSRKIYTTSRDFKPTYAAGPTGQPTSLSVKTTYKPDPKELQRIDTALDQARQERDDAEIAANVNKEEIEAAQEALREAEQRYAEWQPPDNWHPEIANSLYENYERDQAALRERNALRNAAATARAASRQAQEASDRSEAHASRVRQTVRDLEYQRKSLVQRK
jgi:hypothetical protein